MREALGKNMDRYQPFRDFQNTITNESWRFLTMKLDNNCALLVIDIQQEDFMEMNESKEEVLI